LARFLNGRGAIFGESDILRNRQDCKQALRAGVRLDAFKY